MALIVCSFINSNERLSLNNENLKVVITGFSVIIDLGLVNQNSKSLICNTDLNYHTYFQGKIQNLAKVSVKVLICSYQWTFQINVECPIGIFLELVWSWKEIIVVWCLPSLIIQSFSFRFIHDLIFINLRKICYGNAIVHGFHNKWTKILVNFNWNSYHKSPIL